MNRHRLWIFLSAVWVSAALAAQQPPPAPEAPPPPPPAAPAPPAADDQAEEELARARAEVDAVRAEVDAAREATRFAAEEVRARAIAIARTAALDAVDLGAGLALDVVRDKVRAVIAAQAAPRPPVPPAPPASPRAAPRGRHETSERTYERGQRALDGGRWDEALEAFTAVAGKGDTRADGALYWKAYTLNKLGRRDDAIAAIAELRKAYPSSRWLDDARALEAEARQSSGQAARPEAEADDELKLLALNGLVQSDPERALPLLENLLKGSQKPRLKERALFVLAQSNSPRGRQLLEQVARGTAGNPDLQLKAIRYVASSSRRTDNRGLLWEVYSTSTDSEVKRAALHGFIMSKDKDHLLQIARTEKSLSLRMEAISMLGAVAAQSELWGIYQQESSPEIKQQILHSMIAAGSTDRLAELARGEKDAKLRRSAVRALGGMNAARTGDMLVGLYSGESDPQVKSAIVDALGTQRNAKALVDLARKESNPSMKREIVSRLSSMKSKEAADYLLELLK